MTDQVFPEGDLHAETTAEKAVRLYLDGATIARVAQELGVSYGKAHKIIKESGTQIRPRGSRGKKE